MGNIALIAAIGKNNELGKDNNLIWKFKEDMKFFRANTIGKPIVMGRKTFESLPGLLPERKHIILTTKDVELDPEVVIVHSLDELLDYMDGKDEEFMIIGGASLYAQTIDYADELLLTEIDAEDKDADAYFPEFNTEDWESKEVMSFREKDIDCKTLVYKRRKTN